MSGKLLIVDREPQTVRRVQAAAKRAGMSAVVASTTAFALQLLVTERPDIVLFDLTARDGSWVALVKGLRDLDPDISVIATGTQLSMHQVMEAMRHRISDVLEKPLDEDLVTEALNRIVRGRSAVAPSTTIDIVFVDDDPMTLSFASKQLSARGVSARTVSTLRAARQEISDRRPEAVVIDVVLQGESGLDLLPELTSAAPPIPAIIITASADPRVAITALRGGAFSAFPKPLEWDAIYKSIVAARRWVAQQSAVAAAVAQVPALSVVNRAAPLPEHLPPPALVPPRPPAPVFHPQYHVQALVTPAPPGPRFDPRFHVSTLESVDDPGLRFSPEFHAATLALPPAPAPALASAPELPPAPRFAPEYHAATLTVPPPLVFSPLFHVYTLESTPLPVPPPALRFEPQFHIETLVSEPLPEPPPPFAPQFHVETLVSEPVPPTPFAPQFHVETLVSEPLPPAPEPPPPFAPQFHVETLISEPLPPAPEPPPPFAPQFHVETLVSEPLPAEPPPPRFDPQFHPDELVTAPPPPPLFDAGFHAESLISLPGHTPEDAPQAPIFEPQHHIEQLVSLPMEAGPVFEPQYHVELLAGVPAPEPPDPAPAAEPGPAAVEAAPVFEPQFHFELLTGVPAPEPPPAPEAAPAIEPAPVFEPQFHAELLVGVPEPEAPAPAPAPEPTAPRFEPQFHLELMVGVPTESAATDATADAPSFRLRSHCHLHYADSVPSAPLVISPPLPALQVIHHLGDNSDLASQALARAALALASLPSGILVLDARPAVVELNPAAEELLSLPRDRAIDGGKDELPHLQAFFDMARTVLDTGIGRFNQEAILTLPRGQRVMGYGAVPLQKGQREGVLVYFQDITRRRGAASQQRKNERLASLGMIAAGLTAELADPVSMASTYADLIQKETASLERCHHHAGRLRTALTRTTQLAAYVTTLLHRPPSEPGPVDLHEVIQGVLSSLQRKLLLGNRETDQFLAATAPLVMGESIDFEHLVLTVMVSCHQAVPRGGSLRVTSHNHTGIFEMIAEAREASIDQTDPGLKPLGEPPDVRPALEICRSLVKRYGGAIRVDSEPGIKRRFTVRLLPARPEQCTGWAVLGVPAPPITTNHEQGESPVTLLVADEITRGHCISWLDEAGVFVLAAANTEEALEAVHKLTPKVLVVQGPLQHAHWQHFLRKTAEAHTTAILNLLDQNITPRLQADLDELPGHHSLRWPVDRLGLVQALALAELDGMELQATRQSGSFERPRQDKPSE